MKSSSSTLDLLYRATVQGKFFTAGWCKPEANLSRLFALRQFIVNKEECNILMTSKAWDVTIDKEESDGHLRIYDGHFKSPLAYHFPDIVAPAVETARFQMIVPKYWKSAKLKPVVVQLAGTGDHYFWRRRLLLAKPLAKHNGVGSILLENPFYGSRKPPNQKRSCLRNVTDLFVMGGCLITESIALLDWCEKLGYGPLALTGISMGGHMCSLAACNYQKPISLIPCLSWSTASGVFTKGAMSGGVAWKLLQQQYYSTDFQQTENPILTALKHNDQVSAFMYGRHIAEKCSEVVSEHRENVKNSVISNIPTVKSENERLFVHKIKRIFENWRFVRFTKTATDAEVVEFMRGVMDSFTHIGFFEKPVDPSLIIVISALKDAYVPRDGTVGLSELWPEAEFRFIRKGHIGAFLFEQSAFREAIVDALEKNAQKYYNGSIRNNETGSVIY